MTNLRLSNEYDIKSLKQHGVYVHKSMVSETDIKNIRNAFNTLIDAGKITPPRNATAAYGNAVNSYDELDAIHKKMNDASVFVSDDILSQGPNAYRNDVVHVTLKNPFIDLPGLLNVFLGERLLEFASSYLGGPAFLGYIKVKKSFANELAVRSYNHKYHIDDNAENILKAIVYLNDVGEGGGGFNYVMRSHSSHLPDGQTYWSESELLTRFPQENLVEIYGLAGDMVFADTKGIHKEGRATTNDRMAILANYVLEEEYGGKYGRQKINEVDFAKLMPFQQQAIQFFNVVL